MASGEKIPTEPEDDGAGQDAMPSAPIAPLDQPAALGIGLCDSANVLTPEQRLALTHDLALLAAARRRCPSTNISID